MAYVQTRHTRRGDRFDVKWRAGGTRAGTSQTVTFDDARRAERFAQLVDLNGQHLPPGVVLDAMGFADVAAAIVTPAPAPAASAAPLLVDYCRSYVTGLTRPRPKQVRDYLDVIRRHVEPFFTDPARYPHGATIVDVTRADMRSWQRWCEREGGHNGKPLSASTVRRVRASVLSPALAAACTRQDDGSPGLRTWNPFDDLDAPPVVRNPTPFFDNAADSNLLLRGAYGVDVDTGDAVAFMLACGPRFGEVFGLTRPAVSIRRRRFEVRAVAAVVDRPGYYELRAEPKSDSGWRTLTYPDTIAAMLERRTEAARFHELQLLFPGAGTPVMQHSTFRGRYRRAVDNAVGLGLERDDVTPHGLRTSMLTHVGESNVPATATQRYAGHQHLSTTQRYTRNTGAGDAAITAAMQEFMTIAAAGTPLAA